MTAIRPSRLLAPASVAVVGATERPGSYGDTVIRNLDEAGYGGSVFGINPGRDSVHGHPCFPTIRDLPAPVDAVVVAVPAPAVIPVVEAAISTGCGGAVVVSAGFGETKEGEALEAELSRLSLAAGFPVCGPNGNGVISLHHKAPLWGDSVPAHLRPGTVAMISQSGNVAVNAIGSRRGIDFHTVVSTGNQAVLDTGDWLAAIARLDGVRSIALFQETDGDGAKLAEALASCAEREIGVAVLKVGSSQAGQAAAAAHTGAIAGDQQVFRALIEEAGAAWATDPHELLEIARVLAEPKARIRRYDPTSHRDEVEAGLAILTCSGGDSGIAADQAGRLGLGFAELLPGTKERLTELLPGAATVGNPLDYTSLLWFETDLLTEIVETVGRCETVEQMIIFHDHPSDLRPEHESEWAVVREALTDGALRSGCPAILASTLPDLVSASARGELKAAGVPVVGGLRAAIAAASAGQMMGRVEPESAAERLRRIAAAAETRGKADGMGAWMSEHQAKSMLRTAGIAVPDSHVASTPAQCVEVSAGIGFPLALKLSGPSIQHKSELGAVRLGIRDEDELLDAARELLAVAGQLHLRIAQASTGTDTPAPEPPVFLLEEMAGEGTEVLITARSDAVVPSLTVGLGGIWAEYLADSVVVPLPASTDQVLQAMSRLKGYGVLLGSRGTSPTDLDALAEFAARVGHLFLEYRDPHGRAFDLIELNPVLAGAEGTIALDAVAHLA